MKKIKVCIIGAGNISNTRHIPALIKNKNTFEVIGVISDQEKKIKRTVDKYSNIPNTLILNTEGDIEQQLSACKWFCDVDATVIGTPPKQHYPMAKACLKSGKHVLVEKPMAMNVEQCDELQKIAHEKDLVLYVMHSFQFSAGMIKLVEMYQKGQLGEIQSILELQLSNRDRRLPVWYNELPLGLFYDEAAHFFYGARRIGGKLDVLNAHAQYNDKVDELTPRFLEIQMQAGKVPVQMYMNFNSPICEWGLCVICSEKIAIYDYFKDILIVLKNDKEHYAKDVLRTSVSFSAQFWYGFIKNGFKMLTGKLLYGHDECIKRYGRAIIDKEQCFELSAELGKEVVGAMNDVISLANRNET